MEKIYFKGLNGVRAIAAFIVITSHIDQFLSLFGLKSLGYHSTGMAGYGVILFFVLSGYLITYLLLTEKKKWGRIEIAKFYMRRILRIWPIYYLVILLTGLIIWSGQLIIPEKAVKTLIPLYVLFVPNVAVLLKYSILTLTPLWSVGVEEQFYAFWPWLLSRARNILFLLLSVIGLFLIVKILLRIFENGNFYSLVVLTTFDSMAIGGVMANFVFEKNKTLRFFFQPWVQVISWLFLAISVFYKPVHVFSLFDSEIHSILYAVIILNVSANPRSLVNLENKVMNFLGRISYGLYVFHMTIIWLLSFLFKGYIKIIPNHLQYVSVFLTIYTLTIIVAYLSYTYFESFFLKRKILYSKIFSTN